MSLAAALRLIKSAQTAAAGIYGLIATAGCGLVDDDAPTSAGATSGTGGGSSVATGTGGSVALNDAGEPIMPADNRPTPPVWQPFPLGTVGWETSTTPFCDTHQGRLSTFAVWADTRGVFVVSGTVCDGGTMESPNPPCEPGTALQFNDGTGWRIIYGDSPNGAQLTGFPTGPVVLSTSSSLIFVGGVNDTFGGPGLASATLETLPWDATQEAIAGAFFDAPDHAYLITATGDASVPSVLREYRAGSWNNLGKLASPCTGALWAGGGALVSATGNQDICEGTSASDIALLPGIPAGDYNSVWGFSANDIWFGNRAGQLVHFDGHTWQVVQTEAQGFINLWGADGVIYYYSNEIFGRWNGTTAETLLREAPTPNGFGIQGVWGRSKDEVFLAMEGDYSLTNYRCGDFRLVWFDGKQFHLF